MDGWTQIAPSLWCAEGELRMFPATWMPVRCTAIQLASGDWWVHSPIKFQPQSVASIQGQGAVKHLVAPSGFHHLYMPAAQAHFPQATVWAPPLVASKQPQMTVNHPLGGNAPQWANEIEPLHIAGMPKVQEWVFFHHATQSLIVTDLVFNLGETRGLLTPVFLTLFGTRGRFAQSRLFKSFVKDHDRYSAALSKLLEWPVKRVIMAHGTIVDGDDVHGRLAQVLGN